MSICDVQLHDHNHEHNRLGRITNVLDKLKSIYVRDRNSSGNGTL